MLEKIVASKKRPGRTVTTKIVRVEANHSRPCSDTLATEEPLEIRLVTNQNGQRDYQSISVTMRTPGNDFELAAGFLFNEGIVTETKQITRIDYCSSPSQSQNYNILNVHLHPEVAINPHHFSRNVYTTSSCGVCGKTSLDMLQTRCPQQPLGEFQLSYEFFTHLPEQLSQEQTIFSKTGGLHATALFDPQGQLLLLREDIGRHNALDKIVGHLLLNNNYPASNTIALLSGRAGFELIQKAVTIGIPVVAAIGAPSSLAVDLARSYQITLIGFLRHNRFNIYSGKHRILYN